MKEKILPVLLAGFILGIAAGSFSPFGWALPALFLLCVLSAFLVGGLRPATPAFLISVFLLSFSLGLSRAYVEEFRYTNDLSRIENEKIIIRGVVDDYPDARETTVRSIIIPEEIDFGGEKIKSEEKIMVSAGFFPEVHYGDEISLYGTLKRVKNPPSGGSSGSGLVEFDYQKQMEKQGIFHEMISPEISVISSGHGNKIVSSLYYLREKFSGKIRENIKEPESALALGMVLGEKHGLSRELTNVFKRAGIVHMIVLSGYNIALVSQFFMKIFSFLPIVYRSISGALAIIFFIIMTGGGASSIRAGAMALIALLGSATGRSYDAGRALFIAGALMLLENPNLLIYDSSFQLSFLATLGLIYLSPVIFEKLGKWRPAALKELMAQTIATQISVLPLIIYISGMISIVSLPVNILVLPASPLQMFGIFVTGILGFLGHIAVLPFALITSILLSHTVDTAQFFSDLPFSVINIGWTGLIIICLIYSAALAFFLFKKRSVLDI